MDLESVIQSEVSQKEKQIPYINVYILNLEKWYWWTYLEDRSRYANVESQHVDTEVEGEEGVNWEIGTDVYAPPCVKRITSGKLPCSSAQLGALWWPRAVGSLEKETANPLQKYCLENPMGRGAGQAIVHRVAQSQTWLSITLTHTEGWGGREACDGGNICVHVSDSLDCMVENNTTL